MFLNLGPFGEWVKYTDTFPRDRRNRRVRREEREGEMVGRKERDL